MWKCHLSEQKTNSGTARITCRLPPREQFADEDDDGEEEYKRRFRRWEGNGFVEWGYCPLGRRQRDKDVSPLWARSKKNPDKIAIQSFTVPRVKEWAKWASERASERSGARERSEQGGASSTSERCEQTSERTSEWPSTPVCILGCSGPQCCIAYLEFIVYGIEVRRVVVAVVVVKIDFSFIPGTIRIHT